MLENSSAGLVMLGAEATVAVTREEHHQQVLARYSVTEGGQRHVAVELGWCVISSGKYRGEQAVEVRLDGERVGELTYAMSQRYGPLVGQVTGQGGRPGCEALIRRGAKGLEMVLRLPRQTEGTAVLPAAVPTPDDSAATAPLPAVTPGAPPRRRFPWKRPLWIAAAVVGAFFVIGIIGSILDPNTTETGDTDPLTTSATPPTTTTTPTTPTPSSSEAAPPPPPSPATKPPEPKPKPKPQPQPQPEPEPQPEPVPEPEPAPPPEPDCDSNYTGCVPVASDVDCAGGSGNGPAYVAGPVRVVGTDVYGLDHDNDGIGCED